MRRLGHLIVIGGHSRGVGKTALVEQLLAAPGSRQVAAVKVSGHRHADPGQTAPVLEETTGKTLLSQTGRYLVAGAGRAWLCRCPAAGLSEAAAFVEDLLDRGWNVIVESNRIVEYVAADVLLFVVSGATTDWKPSSAACLRRADAVVLSPGTLKLPAQAVALAGPSIGRAPAFHFTAGWTVPGIRPWVHAHLARTTAGPPSFRGPWTRASRPAIAAGLPVRPGTAFGCSDRAVAPDA